ncbi:MAG TPA: clostripain-related cysteine peptidase [Elusimicrobiales bacterium]|nr:clostripain-related cysteine peptidase [Elusimicrobiales bacterium]
MNKLFAAVLCLSMASAAFATDFDQLGSVSQIVKQLNAAAPGAGVIPLPGNPKAAKKWTVMVFVNAKNNLESFGLKDVNEMERGGPDANVNIVAELGRINGYSTSDGDWKGSRRYLVQKDANINAITSPVVMEIPKSDMGSWQYMVDFVNWTKANYPAQKYALVIWNHGAGWNKDLPLTARGISYDDETGHHMTTPELRQALAAIGGVNILAMDACLMQMAEVAYEVKGLVEYTVASEETEPGDGYTYDTFLGPLAKNPSMGSAELSRLMVDSYGDHYQGINQGGTQSSINMAAMDAFPGVLNGFASALMNANDLAVAKAAKAKTQAFYYSTNKDLYHFAKLVAETSANAEVKAAAGSLMGYMTNSLITHNRAITARYANSYGLAVYMPSSYTTVYDALLWAKDTNWDDFTKWLK